MRFIRKITARLSIKVVYHSWRFWGTRRRGMGQQGNEEAIWGKTKKEKLEVSFKWNYYLISFKGHS